MNTQTTCMALLIAAAAMLGGCGSPAGVIFEPPATPLMWPPAPVQPRIMWVGQLATSADLKPAKSGMEALGQVIFGKKDESTVLSPFAACTDGGHRVFVADTGAQMVHVFDLETRKYEQWKPPAPEQFTQPVALVWDPAGRLLVSDSIGGVVYSFGPDGKMLGKIGAGILQRPTGIALEPETRRIFVADVVAHQVVVLNPEGGYIQRIGERGSDPGQFNYPTNLVFDHKGRLYVSDSLNFRIQQFSALGLEWQRFIGRHGDVPGTFSQPKGIAVDSEDHLYVVDSRFENFQIFDESGQLLLAVGEEGRGPGQFWLPAGIFIDAQNRIWIADTYNQRIQVLQYLANPPVPAGGATLPATRPAEPDRPWDPSRGGPVPMKEKATAPATQSGKIGQVSLPEAKP